MRPHIPHLQCRILTPRDQQPRIRTKRTLINRRHVSSQRIDEFPIPRIPDLGMVVETRRRDEQSVGRKRDVVDLFLVAQESGDGLGGLGGLPQVHGEVVAGGDEPLDDFALNLGRFEEAFLRVRELGFVAGGDLARVVVVGGAHDEVGGEREVVDPVGVDIQ